MSEPTPFSTTSVLGGAGALHASDSIGRFVLRKQLGQGAQSAVWLAFDPRMEREVAIKLMRPGQGSDDQAVAQWLQEARSVGRVAHPNIIQVYEADIHGRQPYLVFEYVAGQTLDQIIRERGAVPTQQAAAWMMDVLDAVATAHAAGVVHRDLKPSNVLIDQAGRARVMDFGIAARIRDSSSTEPAVAGGTIGYLSPEAANGAEPATSMDIFSAGVVLAELIMGRRLIEETDPHRAIYRVVHEQLLLPDDAGVDVDDRLRAIINRSLVHDPRQRFVSARIFQSELEQWSQSSGEPGAPGPVPVTSGTLEFLLRRMRHKSDFPTMSDSVIRIQNMAASETESVGSITNEILKDVALTNKLLRLVNSAHFGRSGSISTVSRAVSLVGFNGIRNMALSLVLVEHMQDKAHAAQLKEEFLRSLLAGSIGGELCKVEREGEEAFIGAMFQNLGRLLVLFYFPEEALRVRNLMQNPRQPVSEISASISVLGLSYEALGIGIARAWNLPEDIQRCMRKPAGEPPSRTPFDDAERIRWVALAANEIADVLLHSDPQEREGRLAQVTRKYMQAMGVSTKEVQLATNKARQKLADLAAAMEIRVAPGSAAAKLLKASDVQVEAPVRRTAMDSESQFGGLELQATPTSPDINQMAPQRSSQVAETLAAGIQDITNAMVEDFKLSDVLRMILETMYRAMEFDRIIFCMRDAKTEMITGRFGLGLGVERCVKVFKTHLQAATPDLFSVVCQKGTDTMISDATEPRIVQRLPDWYRMTINAPTFLLLPLQIKGAPFGLIYADKTVRDSLELDDKELALLRTLRNQAVMAFKQST